MRYHVRGLDLVVELSEAAEHVEQLTLSELRTLLRDAALVLGELLASTAPQHAETLWMDPRPKRPSGNG